MFNWDQYQQAPGYNNTTGQPAIDPSQLQGQPWSMIPGATIDQNGYTIPGVGTVGLTNGATNGQWTPDPTASHFNSVSFDPSMTSPSSPLAGGGGLTGGMLGTPTGQPGSGDPNAFRDAWFSSPYPKTVDGLKQFVPANPQYGAQIAGSKGSKVIIGGQAFQAVRSAGLGGGIGPAWDPLGAAGAEGGSGTLSGIGGTNQFGQAAGFMTAPIGQFTPPSYEDALNSPGNQYALSEAGRFMQNNAAARGTLLNARTLQAENAAMMGNANTLYGDMYNRAANTYGINYQTQTGNQDRPFQKYLSLGQLGANAAQAS